jgi:hypothetical protein
MADIYMDDGEGPFDAYMIPIYENAKAFLHCIFTGDYEGLHNCGDTSLYIDLDVQELMETGDQQSDQHLKLYELMPKYSSYVLWTKYRPRTMVACASTFARPNIMDYVLSLNPQLTEGGDRLFIIEHAIYDNFVLICHKFGTGMIDEIICFEAELEHERCVRRKPQPTRTYMENPREAVLDSLHSVTDHETIFFASYYQNRPADSILDSMQFVKDIDAHYEPRWAICDTQLRKFVYLLNHSNRGEAAKEGMLLKIVEMDFLTAVQSVISWGALPCNVHTSAACILNCIKREKWGMLRALLRDPTFAYGKNETAHMEIVNESWPHCRHQWSCDNITELMTRCNFTYSGVIYHVAYSDSPIRLTALYKAGVTIKDRKQRKQVVTKDAPWYDENAPEKVAHLVELSTQPRSLKEYARLCIKTQVGPCKYEGVAIKMNQLPLPTTLVKYLCDC